MAKVKALARGGYVIDNWGKIGKNEKVEGQSLREAKRCAKILVDKKQGDYVIYKIVGTVTHGE